MLDVFLDRCCKRDVVEQLRSEVISLNASYLESWLDKRDYAYFRGLEKESADVNNWTDYMQLFKLMVKREAKVKLDSSAMEKHAPAQNIVYHQKMINTIYGPIFKALFGRIKACLADNIVVYTEMNLDEFAVALYQRLGAEDRYFKGEIDFSKYDKSQDYFLKTFELKLYEHFGFDLEFLEYWTSAEYYCSASSIYDEMSFSVVGQRRSGAANTFLGNTIINLAILAMHYDLPTFDAVAVAGDDSILFRAATPVEDASQAMVVKYGMDAKFLKNKVPYFCSKFILFTDDRIYFVPDPYKLAVKLGKPLATTSYDEICERFVSFCDLTKDFHRESVLRALELAVNSRYGIKGNTTYPALCALHGLSANRKKFLEIYPFTYGWLEVAKSRLAPWFLKRYPLYDASDDSGETLVMLDPVMFQDQMVLPNFNGWRIVGSRAEDLVGCVDAKGVLRSPQRAYFSDKLRYLVLRPFYSLRDFLPYKEVLKEEGWVAWLAAYSGVVDPSDYMKKKRELSRAYHQGAAKSAARKNAEKRDRRDDRRLAALVSERLLSAAGDVGME